MKIAFASAHPYIPQIAGGSQSNTHEMTFELLARGHRVSVLCGLTKQGTIGLRDRLVLKLPGRGAARDAGLGYPVYRAWFAEEGAADVVRRETPDVAVVQSGRMLKVAQAFREMGVAIVIYLHNVEFDDHAGDIADFADETFIANSQFTAERYRKHFGIESTVINPLFQPERYTTGSTRERVLFVNPHPSKGAEIAFGLARACPEIPFDFVESWTLSDDQRARLAAVARECGNIQVHPRSSDMRPHYGRARVVLMPSRWEESWGRIASEAHYSGLPVLATRIGGLAEAVGPGGVLLDPEDGIDAWAHALRRLWNEPEHYEAVAKAARDYAERPQIRREHQIATLESILQGVTAAAPAATGKGF